MTTVNGWTNHEGHQTSPAGHLGKRKRSDSPTKVAINGAPNFHDILQQLHKHDTSPSVLNYSLPFRDADLPRMKRTRLSQEDQENDTIESRLNSGAYTSLDEVIVDITSCRDAILQNLAASSPSKTRTALSATESLNEQTSRLLDAVFKIQNESQIRETSVGRESAPAEVETTHVAEEETSDILTLRTHTDRGTHQLFTGMGDSINLTHLPEIDDLKKLPHGFDSTQPLPVHAGLMIPPRDVRQFGDVFRPSRNAKGLEIPFVSKQASRPRRLQFTQDLVLDQINPTYKQDYNFTPLATGAWLQYGDQAYLPDRNAAGSAREPLSGAPDIQAALVANQILANGEERTDALFRSVYSSFAPASDNSQTIISDHDRSRQWWRKYGDDRMHAIFNSHQDSGGSVDDKVTIAVEDEFADVVANFEPVDEADHDQNQERDSDDVLGEISDLIETLNSYQKIRSLQTMPSKPDSGENRIYEMLRSQLIILVASLPPFAVAKLDGDSLGALNISTNLLVEQPEYRGTGPVDEFTLKRTKLAQAAISSTSRNTAAINQRGPYQPSANSTANAQPRAYTSNVAAGSYIPRPSYQQATPSTAPRPIQGRPQYQQSASSYAGQTSNQALPPRPLQNGYGSYGSPSVQPSYVQQPSQPGYQQRAQASAIAYARTASPQKSSGTIYQQPTLQPNTTTYSPAQINATVEQRAIMEKVKAQQSQSPAPSTPVSYAQSPPTNSVSNPNTNRPQAVGGQ